MDTINSIGTSEIIEIQTHNFENAKNALRAFSKRIPSSTDLPTVKTEKGPFGWFNHKVTGSELNSVTEKVQNFLVATNQQQINVIKEFEQVYQTFEALDKDYIQKIIVGITVAKKASDEAKNASIKAVEATVATKKQVFDIDSLIERQSMLIDKFAKFKKRIEDIPHIDNISTMWKDIEDFKKTIQSLQNNINQSDSVKLLHRIQAQEQIIEGIIEFKADIEAIPHIQDFEIVWDGVHDLENQLESISAIITNAANITNDRFVKQEELIVKQNEELISLVDKNRMDIFDKLTAAADKQAEQNKEFIVQIESIQKGIVVNEAKTNERFITQGEVIVKQNDDLVSLIDRNRVDLTGRLTDAINKQEDQNGAFATHIEVIKNCVNANEITANERLQAQYALLLKKIKLAYTIAGIFGAITVTHIVLATLGIV